MSSRRYKVVLSSALSAVPQSQVGLAFSLSRAAFILRCCRRARVPFDWPQCPHVPASSLRSKILLFDRAQADLFLAWIGRRKTLLAYTVIFTVGAVRNFVCHLHLILLLTCAGTGTTNNSKW